MPTISVVIPAYNSEKTIRETINSVLNQTFSDFELIAIDDGSTDSTLDIISSIQDSRLRVFSYPNSGVSVSRNRGIAQSKGEFIAFLDHDDLWTPDKLDLQLKALQENPQAAVAYSWIDVIDESNQFVRSCIRVSVTDARAKLLVNNFLYTASNPLIRKEALIEVGGFDESLSGPEDWDLFLRLSSHYQFITVPHSLILFRRSAGSVSSNTSRMEAAALQVINRAFEQSPESLQHLRKYSLSTLYLYLTFKGLDAPSQRQNGVVAARHLWHVIKADPSLLRQWATILKALFKITAAVLLPPQQAQKLVTLAESIFGRRGERATRPVAH